MERFLKIWDSRELPDDCMKLWVFWIISLISWKSQNRFIKFTKILVKNLSTLDSIIGSRGLIKLGKSWQNFVRAFYPNIVRLIYWFCLNGNFYLYISLRAFNVILLPCSGRFPNNLSSNFTETIFRNIQERSVIPKQSSGNFQFTGKKLFRKLFRSSDFQNFFRNGNFWIISVHKRKPRIPVEILLVQAHL